MSFSRRQFCTRMLSSTAVAGLGPLRAAERPKLPVWIAAGQFRPDYLDDLWPSLSPGGFRRLAERGAYVPDCQFDAPAFTDSGPATLLAGFFPGRAGDVMLSCPAHVNETVDVAPALARSFGLSLPPSATERVLGEMIEAPVKAAR